MFAVPDRRHPFPVGRKQLPQDILALDQGHGSKIMVLVIGKIEGIIDEVLLVAALQDVLQLLEVRRAVRVQHHDLAVEDRIPDGKARQLPGNGENFSVQSWPRRVSQCDRPSLIRASSR